MALYMPCLFGWVPRHSMLYTALTVPIGLVALAGVLVIAAWVAVVLLGLLRRI